MMREPDLQPLLSLVDRRWNVPVLAYLHVHAGAKFVTLANRLEVGRGSLSASLAHLVELGLVRRNTGHGHPMRPEYLLTGRGRTVGAHCAAIAATLRGEAERDLAYRKWSLPLVAVIGDGRVRFRDLRASLRQATPRAITLGLKSLSEQGWVARSVINDYPPVTGYHLLARGRRIGASLAGLVPVGVGAEGR